MPYSPLNPGDALSTRWAYEELLRIAAELDLLDVRLDNLFVNVKDFRAKGDGSSLDTTAIQNAINSLSSGQVLFFPAGRYRTGALALPATKAVRLMGAGRDASVLVAAAAGTTILSISDNYAFSVSKEIFGLGFDAVSLTAVTAISAVKVRDFVLRDAAFKDTTTNLVIDRARGFEVSNIKVRDAGQFKFYSSDAADFIKGGDVHNVSDPAGQSMTAKGVGDWFVFERAINVPVRGVNTASLGGTARGFEIRGACEGVYLEQCIVVWPTTGVRCVAVAGVRPQYSDFMAVAVDQPSLDGFDIDGEYVNLESCVAANGVLKGVGQGVVLRATARYINVSKTLIRDNASNGLGAASGAKDVCVRDCDIFNNASTIGAQVSVTVVKPFDVLFKDNRIVGTTSVTGSRLIGGSTSDTVHRDTGSAATTAVITAEDLMSYTVPGGTVESGMKVRLRAWGTFAANANTKTIRMFFGATNMGGASGTFNNLPWNIDALIEVTSGVAQEYSIRTLVSTQSPVVGTGTSATTLTANFVCKMQGQNGVASANDIVCQGFEVTITR